MSLSHGAGPGCGKTLPFLVLPARCIRLSAEPARPTSVKSAGHSVEELRGRTRERGWQNDMLLRMICRGLPFMALLASGSSR